MLKKIIHILENPSWKTIVTKEGSLAHIDITITAERIIAVVADDIEMNHDQDEYRFIVKYLRGLLDI